MYVKLSSKDLKVETQLLPIVTQKSYICEVIIMHANGTQ